MKEKENDNGRIVWKNNKLVFINHEEPVIQVRQELVVLGMIVSVN